MAAITARSPVSLRLELRRCWRLLQVLVHILYGLLLALLIGAFWRPYRPLVQRATRHWLRRLLDILSVDMDVQGQAVPGTMFLVSNHVSWLDIPLIGVQRPVHFLSKAEVRDWPLIGLLAQAAGTLFIYRGNGESRRKSEEIAAHLRIGRTILVFPEGTTTDGRAVRRFYSQLFAAPMLARTPVQALALRYLDDRGEPDRELAFIDDDEFHLHLWGLLRRDRIRVQLRWGPVLPLGPDHERLARMAHAAVSALLNNPETACPA